MGQKPIAIVGIGCRFPGGVKDPAGYWDLLKAGKDAITDVPETRWSPDSYYDPKPGLPGKSYTRRGGFLEGIENFDPGFFGISPREATRMDPQQRQILETAWEALEDGGHTKEGIAGTDTGVFIGISSTEYATIQTAHRDLTAIDTHSGTGSAMSIAANRISYCFNLRGPSLALDTACSSSLVAVHLACESIHRGECSMALAGGVNAILKPDTYVIFSSASMLSADGKCRTFDAGASGFVRGEGAGVLVLKPLDRALADNDRIYAVVRGTATNQDGRSNGLTVPDQSAQEEMLRQVCARADVAPEMIQYVEAHGTGTMVGDPIEAIALGNIFGRARANGHACVVGSVKTNIGHLEPASGIAGIIKVALALQHEEIPANLHFKTPNPHIPFEDLKIRVPTEHEKWPEHDGPALAGVNSFGFGGANASAILAEAPKNGTTAGAAISVPSQTVPRIVPLTARSENSLKKLAAAMRNHLQEGGRGADFAFDDICWSTAMRRSHHEHRLAVIARDRDELIERLGAYAENGESRAEAVAGQTAHGQAPRVAFVLSGQGPQWWAMGRELLDSEPVFREVIEDADKIIREIGTWSLLEELRRDEASSRMQETSIAQPAIFALQVGLARLWASWGIEPDAVVGHSVGEVAAAHLSGALSFDSAVRVIFHRGRCMDFADAHGQMLAVGLPHEQAQKYVEGKEDKISLAAINSPDSVTLSGDGRTLEKIAEQLDKKDIFNRFLKVNYAFHSPMMDPMRKELLDSLEGVDLRSTTLPMYSTVTGSVIEGSELGPEYWWRNVRHSVWFSPSVDRMIDDGYDVFVELAPHPVLSGYVNESLRKKDVKATVVHSLRRENEEYTTMLKALATLYTVGCPMSWEALVPKHGRFVPLPRYRWDHSKYWSESEESRDSRIGADIHPLLGHRLKAALPTWEKELAGHAVGYLSDHCVQGQALLPGTSYLELAAIAARELHGPGRHVLESIDMSRACFISDEDVTTIQVTTDPSQSVFRVMSRMKNSSDPAWTAHVTGKIIAFGADDDEPAMLDVDAVRARCLTEFSAKETYPRLAELGLEYGPAFQGIDKLWAGDGEALAWIVAPEEIAASIENYEVHPAMLDACLQTLICAIPRGDRNSTDGNTVYLPVEFRHVRIHDRIPAKIWSHARLIESEDAGILADIRVYDGKGRTLVEIRGVRCQAVDGGTREDLSALTYEYKWQYAPRPGHVAAQTTAEMLPSPTRIAEQTSAAAAGIDGELRLCEQVHKIQEVLDPLSRAFMRAAFVNLGSSMAEGKRFTTAELVKELEIDTRFSRLIDRSLEILCEDGSVIADGDGWKFGTFDRSEDPRARWRDAVAQNPGIRPELMLVGRCGQELAGVLRGEVDPVSLIFPEGSLALTEHLYQDSPQVRFDNTLAQRAVSIMTRGLEPGRKLRVLEIGGGTGGLSSYVLPVLPARDTEYVFTDLSNHFFSRGAEKFRDYPFIEFKRLDIENDPCEQDFEAHSFDLILASHVLHATADLRETLANVKRLLSSEGVLLMAETVDPSRWIDLVFGLTEGWWRFTDVELRPKHPLLSYPAWKELLQDCGFSDVCEASGGYDPKAHTSVFFGRGPRFDLGPMTAKESKPVDSPQKWLVFADRKGHAERFASEMKERGHDLTLVTRGEEYRRLADDRFEIPPGDVESMKKLVGEVVDNEASPCKGIVHLWNLDAEPLDSTSPDALDETLTVGCTSVVFLCRALGDVDPDLLPRLWLVTTEAETVGRQKGASVTQAGAWGLNRVIINELPGMRPTSIDMSIAPDDEEIRSLCDEILFDSNEDEIALRGDSRFVHRCMRQKDVVDRHDAQIIVKSFTSGDDREGFRLESGGYGMLDKLRLCKTERVRPKTGEVEIEVAAAGLNFSDVMKALGIYPGLPDGPVPLGIECSGRISAVGEGVTNLSVGDSVLAIGPFCFGSHVITPAGLAVPMPEGMRFEEAATIPIAFLTSYYALIHLGKLQKGEKVLIHSATGGVGLSAIQIAQRAGAEIFATAGTDEKRDLLRSLGIKHVMDSRSLDFAEEILEITNGEGVDVVLNSLAGEAIRKGLEVLGDFGRFLEIGKRDIYANTPVGLRPLRKNVSIMAIDLDRAMRRRPEVLSSLFDELMEGFHDGSLRPFTYRVFPMSNVISAFRHMAQAKHIGKVVVSVQEQEVRVAPASLRPTSFREDATYLITGGLGGFGLVVAEWMVEMGARHLVLMGRSGASSQRAQDVVARLEKLGAEIRVVRGDVSDPKDVAGILSEIETSMPQLRGVLHAAMVLRDALVVNLDQQMMKDVWEPKVVGAWNLHEQTKNMDLDLFVLFSSMSAIFGAGGQANYAAANTVLDSLAVHRRAMGLPGLSIAWGSLAEVGFVAEHADIAERFEKMGIDNFTPHQALTLLGRFLQQESPHVAVMRVDWQRFIEHYGSKQASLRFKSLLLAKLEVEEEVETTGGTAVREALREAKPSERREMLESLLQSEVARVLGASPSELDVKKPLTELGLDSLMAVELKNWIECDLQLSLPTMALMRGPSVSKLSELLVKQLAKLDSRGGSSAPAEATG